MAKQTTVTLVDDMDGTGADETVVFSIGGRDYEIDLSEVNAGKLREAFAPFVDKARVVRGTRRSSASSSGSGSTASREETQKMRAWANENGFTVSDRGRLPVNVQEAYANRGTLTRLPGASVTPIRPVEETPKPVKDMAAEMKAAVAAVKGPKKSAAKGTTSNGLPKVAPKPKGVKVKAMTGMQTAAVEDMKIPTHEVGKSFVIFAAATPTEVLGMIRAAMQKYDGDKTSGAYPSMKAVVRKLEAADPKSVQVVEVEAA
jgi:hypothetical protein